MVSLIAPRRMLWQGIGTSLNKGDQIETPAWLAGVKGCEWARQDLNL